MSARILVLRTGQAVGAVHTHCGPFFRLFEQAMNAETPPTAPRVLVEEVDVTVRAPGDALPPLERYHGVIMTGSPAFVEENAPWMRYGASVLEDALTRDLPLLGVCFGHQLLGLTLGSDVGRNPRGREMGTITVRLAGNDDDPLLAGLPAAFAAQCTHRDVVRAPSPALRVLGSAAHDPHHVVRVGTQAWGLQFHPEFDETVMRLFLEERRSILDAEHGAGATERRIAAVAPTPHAARILPRFATLCREHARARGHDGR